MTVVVLMGVSGSGKTTIACKLAERLGWRMLEGDALHPPANIAKMRRGLALTDDDRWPWLRAIAAEIDRWRAAGIPGVVTCSALRRTYRALLIGVRTDVVLAYLWGPRDVLIRRLLARQGHFMPAALLDSQLQALEAPGPDEHPIVLTVAQSPDAIVADLLRQLQDRDVTNRA